MATRTQMSTTSTKPSVEKYKNNQVYLEDNYIYISHLDDDLKY